MRFVYLPPTFTLYGTLQRAFPTRNCKPQSPFRFRLGRVGYRKNKDLGEPVRVPGIYLSYQSWRVSPEYYPLAELRFKPRKQTRALVK